ncbi:MAG: helix-turn-helix domain-containing protein [Selenomonadaceae bacterium]|nr:helix-turn-helix domain-containing protein [Selenomonadaceae bacterium]
MQHFDPKDYLKNNYKEFMIPLNQYLQLLLEDKGLTKLDVIRRSQMERHYAYHIFSGTRQNPSRNKVLALANAMRLNLDETQDLLQHSRHCKLCPRSPTDSIIIYAIHQNLDIIKTNSLLEQFGLIDCLG